MIGKLARYLHITSSVNQNGLDDMLRKGTIFKLLTFDRALLVAVLAIQAGMAGWFYTYYKSQQQQRTNNQQPAQLSEAPPRPDRFQMNASMMPAPDRFMMQMLSDDDMLMQNLPALHHMSQMQNRQQPVVFPMRSMQNQQMMARMQHRMQQSMQALQQMHDTMLAGDAWQNVNLAPSMDMKECDDHYEVSYNIPHITNGNAETILRGRLLSIHVNSSEPPVPNGESRQQFQSRIMLPWNVSSNATVQSDFKQGRLVVNIAKNSTE